MSGTEKDILYLMWALTVFGGCSGRLDELVSMFDTPEEIYTALKEDGKLRSRLTEERLAAVDRHSLEDAEKIIGQCDKNNIRLLPYTDPIYPESLKNIHIPPKLLFYKGDISGIDRRLTMGIVGTRKPSEYSLKAAAGISGALARNGFDIISGFAEGIDICAQLSAVRHGGRSYGVLGCGIEWIYPKNNAKYRDMIIENGALISEYLPYMQPFPQNFLQRNRILSGLSMGITVIEAGENSGSLNSASHAAEQGKTVFAVPPCSIFDKRYKGNAMLIREGAVVLMGLRDVIDEYRSIIEHTIDNNREDKLEELDSINRRSETESSEKEAVQPEKKPQANGDNIKASVPKKSIEEITSAGENELQKKILTCLADSPMRADDLVESLSENIDDILTALTELEINGAITAENSCYRIS